MDPQETKQPVNQVDNNPDSPVDEQGKKKDKKTDPKPTLLTKEQALAILFQTGKLPDGFTADAREIVKDLHPTANSAFPFKDAHVVTALFLTSYFSGRRRFESDRGDRLKVNVDDNAHKLLLGAFSVVFSFINAVDSLTPDANVLANGYSLDKYSVPTWVNDFISPSAIRLGAGRKWEDFRDSKWTDNPWIVYKQYFDYVLDSDLINGVPTPVQVQNAIDIIYQNTKKRECDSNAMVNHEVCVLNETNVLLRGAVESDDGDWLVDASNLTMIPMFMSVNFLRFNAKSDVFDNETFSVLVRNIFDKAFGGGSRTAKSDSSKEKTE